MSVDAADILKKCNYSNGIVIRSSLKPRKIQITESICKCGKTVCQIRNVQVLSVPSPLDKNGYQIVNGLVVGCPTYPSKRIPFDFESSIFSRVEN